VANLIFIYGPPAVGKLTVAGELAGLTGYRLFHNHLTVPVVNAIFGRDNRSPERSRLLKQLRVQSMTAAAEANIDLIFTAAYSGGDADEAFVRQFSAPFELTGGRVMFVQLYAPDDVLLERVGNDSRKLPELEKSTDVERYREKLKRRDTRVSVPYDGILHLETTETPAAMTARKIAEYFCLNR
jgi:hypothetical protein